MNRHLFSAVLVFLIVLFFRPVHPQAQQETYPIPASESVEKTGPGTMVFLSYPKYYRNAEEKLVPVETNLVESSDPEWDYEVNKGIWQLKVKTDGTFQAQHEGDIFTYRFQNLGIGQGNAFRSVDLGVPDFSNYQVMGDTIRWTNVLPDVDLTVRYLNHILKVDVIVKKAFMNDLRTEVNAGILHPEDYLTARFDIPSVFVTSQAKQGGEDRDIYAEPIEFTHAPLTFERDGKTLHKLRPVESYVLDAEGQPMYWDASEYLIQIRSSQRWKLQRGGGGFAEMSANLGDLANAPEGDVVIDPATDFGLSDQDTFLEPSNPNDINGGDFDLVLYGGGLNGTNHILFGWNASLPSDAIVSSASIRLYVSNLNNPHGADAQIFPVKIYPADISRDKWKASEASWNNRLISTTWSVAGAPYVEYYGGNKKTFQTGWNYFDATDAFQYSSQESYDDLYDFGFLLKYVETSYETATIYSNYYLSSGPQLIVKYYTGSSGTSSESIKLGNQDSAWGIPYEGALPGAFFNNRWHYYFICGKKSDDKSASFVLTPNGSQGAIKGLAASKSAIDNYVVRDNGGNPQISNSTPVYPYVAYEASGKQFIKLSQSVVDTHKDWFGRMAALGPVWVEGSGSSLEVHGFYHAEDNHIGEMGGDLPPTSEYLKSYGFVPSSGLHVNYTRIGYAKSTDGYSFSHVNGNASDTSNPGPLIECWMSERDWVDAVDFRNNPFPTTPPAGWTSEMQTIYHPERLGHLYGCAHPWVIETGGYLYIFYNRATSHYLPITPNSDEEISMTYPDGTNVRSGGRDDIPICVARAPVSSVKTYNGSSGQQSPWYKFFDSQWDTNQKGVGGYSSPILVSPYYHDRNLISPSVTYNNELGTHIMLVGGLWNSATPPTVNNQGRVYLFLDENASQPFSKWSTGMRLDDIYTNTGSGPAVPNTVWYPFLVSNNSGNYGSTMVSTKNNYFYYWDFSAFPTNLSEQLKRFSFTITN